MNKTRLALLQNMPVFGALREDSLEFILDHAKFTSVDEADFFFREGEQGTSMFVLEQGTVLVLKAWEGRDYELARLGVGDCFGEMSLIEACDRSASVRAEEACRAIELSIDTMQELYQHDLEQFAIIQMNMSREVCRRLRRADDELFEARMRTEPVRGDFGRYAT